MIRSFILGLFALAGFIPAEAVGQGKKYALCIGVNQYKHPKLSNFGLP